MSATVVQDWVSATTGSAASPSNVSVLLGGSGTPATADNTLIVAVNSDATVGTPAGYTPIVSSIHNAGCYLFAKIAAGGETGVTVTPAVAASTSVAIAEFGNLTGATIAARVDATASGGSSTGQNTRSTGTTGGTVQADELAVAVWGYSASTAPTDFAAGGGNKWVSQTNSFTEKIDTGTTKTSGTNVGLCVAVKDLSATGTVESTGTLLNANSVPGESLIATFKASAGSTPVSLADTGSAADALPVTATAPLADTASAADTLAVPARTIALADAAAGAEALIAAASVALADTATAADALTAAAVVPMADTGSATQSMSVAAMLALSDAASATDTVDNGAGTAKSMGDAGSAADALTVAASVALTDAAAAGQSLTVAGSIPLADTATAGQAITIAAATPLNDTGSAGQAITASAVVGLADSASASDAALGQDAANVSRSFGDTGSAADALMFVPGLITGRAGVTGDPATATASGDAVAGTVSGDPIDTSVTGVY